MGQNRDICSGKSIQKGAIAIKMSDDAVKRLATGISLFAVSDLDATYKKTMKPHKVCCKGGKCDTEKLISHLIKFVARKDYTSLPFRQWFEHSALDYFSNSWGEELLGAAGISYLPKDFKDRLEFLKGVYDKCRPCMQRCIKDAEFRLENERELTVAE